MAYPKRELIVVPEGDDEITGESTCWGMVAGKCDNRTHYIWITKYDEKEYIVEDSRGNNLAGKKVFKTLWGAKREAEGIAWRQDESGFFTD